MIMGHNAIICIFLVVAVNNFSVFSLKIPGVKISCSPRSFSITAPCQATCAKPKPKLCIRKPGCFCANGIFDPVAKACVDSNNCDPKNMLSKEGGSASGGGGGSIHIKGSFGGSGSGGSSSSRGADVGASGGKSKGAGGGGTGSGDGGGQGGFHASVHISGGGGISGAIKSIFSIPIKLFKGVGALVTQLGIKDPLLIGEKGINLGKGASEIASKLTAKNIATIVGLAEGLAGKMGQLFVSIGVLQGQTVEDVVTFVEEIIIKVVNLGMDSQTKIADGITGTIEKIGSILQIKPILDKIEKLPVIKSGVKITAKIRLTLNTQYKDQIDELKFYIQNQINKHSGFFDPIMNRVSSSILIIFNSLNAIVDGKLNECSGLDGPDKSPVGSLQRKMHIYIDEVKVFIFEHIGFKGTAQKGELELKQEKEQPPPPKDGTLTIPPPITTMMSTGMPTSTTPSGMIMSTMPTTTASS